MTRSLRPLLATALIFLLAYLLAVLQHPAMFSTRVLGNFLTDNAFLGIAAVGMTFVILSGGIDLSVGAVIGFTTVLIAVLIMWLDLHPLLAFAIALAVATLFGAIMGAAIHFLQVPSFIVTLAGMFLARGGASVLSPDSIGIEHGFYTAVSKSYILLPGGGRLTVVGMVMLAVFAVAILLAHRTRFGSNVYAIGGSQTSAALMGVPVARTTISIYALSSFLAGLAGVVFSLYTSAGYSLNALGVELDAIAAVVIGGTLLTGGYGFVAGTFIGVMLQGLVQTYIVFDGTLSSWWTKIVVGALLFMFIVLQRLVFRAGPRRT
jgi:ribose/xylose/arabinose/galactoside ABC-type transport system permease subunit